MAAAFDQDITRPDEVFDCENGAIYIAGHRIRDHKPFGLLDVSEILAKSSDVAIRFTSEGPEATLVELKHTGIERHGEGYEQLRAALDSPNAWERTLAEFAKAAGRGVRR